MSSSPESDAQAEIRAMVELIGLDRHIEYVASLTSWELERLQGRTARRGITGAVAEPFRREALVATATAMLARGVDRERTSTLTAWMRSRLGREVAGLARDAASPASAQRYRAFVAQLPDAPPPAPRVALLHRLERASETARLELETTRAVRRSIAAIGERLRATGAAVRDDIDGAEPIDEEDVRVRAALAMLFAYQALSDAELQQYGEFLESPTGTWLVRAYRESLLEAIDVAGGQALGRLGHRSTTARGR